MRILRRILSDTEYASHAGVKKPAHHRSYWSAAASIAFLMMLSFRSSLLFRNFQPRSSGSSDD